MSKALAVFSAVAILAAIGVAIGSLVLNIVILNKVNNIHIDIPNVVTNYVPVPEGSSNTPSVSNSNGYKSAAAFLLNGLDDTVDPCVDFYAFTCNKYLAGVTLQDGQQRLGTYDQAQFDVYAEIDAALSKIDVTDEKVSITERITAAAYDSCSRNIENPPNKASVVYDEIKTYFGGVPYFGEALKANIDFFDVAGQIEQKHVVGTLTFSIASSDYKNSTRNALYISPPDLGMARDYYVKPQYAKEVANRVAIVSYVLQSFADSQKKTLSADAIQKAAQDIVNFEVLIAMASWPDDLLRNYQQQYNPYKLSDATVAYGSINWKSYLGQLFSGVLSAADQANVQLVVTEPSYFAWLNSVFGGKTVDPTIIANYMILQIISDEGDFLGEMKNAMRGSGYVHYVHRRGRGVTKIGRRDVRVLDGLNDAQNGCLDLLTAYMPYGTGYVYVKSHSDRDKIQADVIVQTNLVIDNFQGMIGTLTWMDDYSKTMAKNKSDSLIKNYGWPDKLFKDFKDFSVIDNYHQDYASVIDIYKKDKDNLYDIMSVLKKGLEVREFFRIFNEAADRTNFLQSPAMVNAWYQPERNSITFPFAVWNPPYYNLEYPQAYNYAGQGGTGGHELTHGYDDEGVQFGWNGELTNCAWNKCGWMDTNSSYGFTDMAQCVVTQFSTQCCPEKSGNVHCANGATTQGENIADLGGQQAAYRAYRAYIAKYNNGTEEQRLPGLENYTANQIFWITYGYSWCMKQTDANLVRQLLTNPHAPGSCRVNQVMQDIPEFGKDFGCTRGTPMYPSPDGRCKVWVGV